MADIKRVGLHCHRFSPDFAQLQLRNCTKSGDLNKPTLRQIWQRLNHKSLGYGNRADQVLRRVHAGAAHAVVNRAQAVPRDAGQHGLHVLGHDLVAAFEQRPGARAIQQRGR